MAGRTLRQVTPDHQPQAMANARQIILHAIPHRLGLSQKEVSLCLDFVVTADRKCIIGPIALRENYTYVHLFRIKGRVAVQDYFY
jgi:hypothetical protein